MPSTTSSRHFWKLERKKQVRDVIAPIRPPRPHQLQAAFNEDRQKVVFASRISFAN